MDYNSYVGGWTRIICNPRWKHLTLYSVPNSNKRHWFCRKNGWYIYHLMIQSNLVLVCLQKYGWVCSPCLSVCHPNHIMLLNHCPCMTHPLIYLVHTWFLLTSKCLTRRAAPPFDPGHGDRTDVTPWPPWHPPPRPVPRDVTRGLPCSVRSCRSPDFMGRGGLGDSFCDLKTMPKKNPVKLYDNAITFVMSVGQVILRHTWTWIISVLNYYTRYVTVRRMNRYCTTCDKSRSCLLRSTMVPHSSTRNAPGNDIKQNI